MKKNILFITLLLATVCSCNKESVDSPEKATAASFTALAPDSDTKTSIDGSLNMTWNVGDIAWVYPVPKTYPTPEDGKTQKAYTSPTYYTFTNQTAGDAALFRCEDFTPGSFGVGDPYFVFYGTKPYKFNVFRSSTEVDDTDITQYTITANIPSDQVFDPTHPLGISDGTIPMYAVINAGTHEPNAVQFQTQSCILKFVITNSSGAAVNIHHITMNSANLKLAGQISHYITLYPNLDEKLFQGYTGSNGINLNCNDYTLANGATRPFSFVMAALGIESSFQSFGTLTWTVYSDETTVLFTDSWTCTTKKAERAHVYTRSYVIPAV